MVISVCVKQCRLKEERAELRSRGRAFQEGRTSSAKAIRQGYAWHIQKTGRRTRSWDGVREPRSIRKDVQRGTQGPNPIRSQRLC